MNAETLINLLEEMMGLKVQQHSESQLKPNPELAQILAGKRMTDRRRMDQMWAKLIRVLADCAPPVSVPFRPANS